MIQDNSLPLEKHNAEIQENLRRWESKPLLRKIYREFHVEIAKHLRRDLAGISLELGSGIGNIKEVIPDCLRTDLFQNPWIDQVENAYRLSFESSSVSNLILFDVFHHLRYPGTALEEFKRILKQGGRVIIFEPCMSLLGLFIYGIFHHEPIAIDKKIEWIAPPGWIPNQDSYYAAQGNAYRTFYAGDFSARLPGLKIISRMRFASLSYVASGGYKNPQLYPDSFYPMFRIIDRVCERLPLIFALRMLVVLERE